MPRTAPAVKRQAVEGYGAQITLCEPTNKARADAAQKKTEEVQGYFVHPSNEPRVLAGQGSVAVEFLEQCSSLDALVVPVGGGGLIRTTSRDLGIPYDELKKLVSRHRDLLPDEEDYGPEPEPEPCA